MSSFVCICILTNVSLRRKTETMKEQHVYLKDLHFDHKLWVNELAFYKDELKILVHRLEEVTVRNTDRDFLASVEHFQNRFIREVEVIDTLRHDIKQHENVLEDFAIKNPIANDHVHFEDHVDLRDQMVMFRKLYKEMKDEFVRFLIHYM